MIILILKVFKFNKISVKDKCLRKPAGYFLPSKILKTIQLSHNSSLNLVRGLS